MEARRRPSGLLKLGLVAGVALTALSGCKNAPPAEIADRLWVSSMPTGPRDRVDAFVVTEVGKRSAGSFFHGSVYRGSHDSFTWKATGKDRGTIHLLQDRRDYEVRTRPCKPDAGFDMCMELLGDPTGVVRYQSRKRWAIPRRGKGAQALDVPHLVRELADDDDDLEALLDDAWDE